MTIFLLGWLAMACIVAAIICRLTHNAKARDEVQAGINGVLEA